MVRLDLFYSVHLWTFSDVVACVTLFTFVRNTMCDIYIDCVCVCIIVCVYMCAAYMFVCVHLRSCLPVKFTFFQDLRSLNILKYILMNISRTCINLCVHCVKQMSASQLDTV